MKKIITTSLIIVSVIVGYFLVFNLGWRYPDTSFTPEVTKPPIQEHKTFEMVVGNNTIQYLSTGDDEFSVPGYLRANEGDTVTIKITVDEDNELFLHGYDMSIEVKKDVMTESSFIADKVGVFELELTRTNVDLGVIEIFPSDS